MLTIKVLGPGCANCKKIDEIAHRAVANFGLEAQFEKITNYGEMAKYQILATPGLVINEKLVCSGRIPSLAEVTTWVADAAAQES